MLLDDLNLADHGAQLFRAAAKPHIADLLALLDPLPSEQEGVRISGLAGLRPYLQPEGPISSVAIQRLFSEGHPAKTAKGLAKRFQC